MIQVVSIAAFIRRNLPWIGRLTAAKKRREHFMNWLTWNMRGSHICCIQNNGKIEAVGIAKAISNELDAKPNYHFDEKGHILYVHIAIAKNNEAFKSLLNYCKFRWGGCSKIMFNRKKTKRLMKYDIKKFYRKVGI